MAVTAYKTYAVRAPKSTHTVARTCEQVNCEAWRLGWKTALDVADATQRGLARWIVDESGRAYTWEQIGTAITFSFPPGQQCFAEHREQVRPGIYVVRDGDYRGNPTGWKVKLHERAWVDDFGEHQERLADEQRKG